MRIQVEIKSEDSLKMAVRRGILGVLNRKKVSKNPLVMASLAEVLIQELEKRLKLTKGSLVIVTLDLLHKQNELYGFANINALEYEKKSESAIRILKLTDEAISKLVEIEEA